MRAFIYCRVSTREQGTDDHYSLGNQEQRGREYVKMKNWRLHKVRKDIASGKDDNRDALKELRDDIARGDVDVVIVYRLDRLSRNVRDIYDMLDFFRQSGVAFVSMTEGFDTTTAMGRAMLGVAAVFAQLTREMIAENTKDGLMRRAEAGLYNGNKTGVYGYDYDAASGMIVVNPAEAVVVKRIFDAYADRKWGMDKIARLLNVDSVPTKFNTQWQHTSITSILRNPVFAGYVRSGTKLIPGKHEAIIDNDLFERAQRLMGERSTLPARNQSSPHLLSGIARCGMCGRRLKAHYNNGGKKGAGASQRYMSYSHGRSTQVSGERACDGLYKSGPKIENAILEHISRLALSDDVETLVIEDVQRREQKNIGSANADRDKVLMDLDSLGATFNLWADRLDSGIIDDEQFKAQNSRLLDRKKALQAQLAVIDEQIAASESVEVTLAEVKSALKDFASTWDTLELEEKRELLRLLIERLDVYKDHADLKLVLHEPVQLAL